MSKPDYYRSLQILAIEAVEFQDGDAFYRKVCRWYSKTFSTPLTDVAQLSMDHVLTTYYEDTFDTLYSADDEDSKYTYDQYRKKILTPNAEGDEVNEDEEWAMKEIEAMRKKAEAKAKAKMNQTLDNTVKDIVDLVKNEMDKQKMAHPQDPNIQDNPPIDLDNFSMSGEDPFFPE